jgi:hypothetical protein
MKTLNRSAVRYESVSHKYFLGEKELKGITGMIKRQLFPDEYKDVPEDVLQKAQDRGHRIHSLCEFVDEFNTEETTEELVIDYIELKKAFGLVPLESEYVVSDNEHFASPIDKVFITRDDTFILGDIKTTYALNEEYVRWQLSIYAYFFELLNPDAKVEKLIVIWLKSGKSTIKELARIPVDIVKELLKAEIEGEQFKNNYVNVVPEDMKLLEQELALVENQLKFYTDKKKEIIGKVYEMMCNKGEFTWKGDIGTFTRKKDYTKIDFDKAKLKADNEELYNQYLKETTVCGSVTFKINK